MLTQEYGTASNIKSRVNRLSVLAAITSTQQRLKLYSKVPPNGLVVYCGEIITAEGKERKINIDFDDGKRRSYITVKEQGRWICSFGGCDTTTSKPSNMTRHIKKQHPPQEDSGDLQQ